MAGGNGTWVMAGKAMAVRRSTDKSLSAKPTVSLLATINVNDL